MSCYGTDFENHILLSFRPQLKRKEKKKKQFSLQTTKGITTTSVKLEKQSLLSDCKYEARVRARVSVGQWSHWSPVLTFYTGEGEQDMVPIPPKLNIYENSRDVLHEENWKRVPGENVERGYLQETF